MDRTNFVHPFDQRPWMANSGAAVLAGKTIGLKGIVAGGITGGIEVSLTYPAEYVKTQLQLDGKGANKRYKGIADCVKKTVKQHGFFGLYRGMGVLFYGSMPKAAARFGVFEYFRQQVVNERGQLSNSGKLICGLGAGVIEAIVAVTPMETIKVKFISDQLSGRPQYKGLAHGVRTIIKQEGLSGLYQGLTPTILRQGSNQAIRFFVVENLKDLYKGEDRSRAVPKPIVGLFGAIAGAASVLGNTPLDVIKTHMQSFDAWKYRNTVDCAVQIWRNEGPSAFYKGALPRLGRTCLDVAITFMIYDSFMELFSTIWM